MKLYPNTYTGLIWGLIHFDAIETDLRLSKDNKLIIYHDPTLPTGELIRDLTQEELVERDIPILQNFLKLKQVGEFTKTKMLYLELKRDCKGGREEKTLGELFFQAFKKLDLSIENIHLISFTTELLKPFVGTYPCYPIIPNLNECSKFLRRLRALPQLVFKSMNSYLEEAVDMGWAGIFFARQVLNGPLSRLHPSYEEMVQTAKEKQLVIGMNVLSITEENTYNALARFTDDLVNPRRAKEGEGPIIAHRGTGHNGIDVAEEDVPQLSFD